MRLTRLSKLTREEIELRVIDLEAENAFLYRTIREMTQRIARRNAMLRRIAPKLVYSGILRIKAVIGLERRARIG
jgi:hypothetical protein